MRGSTDNHAMCEKFLPGLLPALTEHSFRDLETPRSPAIPLFKRHGGPGLLVPAAHGGRDASPLEAVQVIGAVAEVAPSLAIATAMHHFSVATLLAVVDEQGSDALETILLKEIAAKNLLMASGGAEGISRQSIVAPAMRAEPVDGGYLINGSKRPCSLARSMDMLTATVAVPRPDGGTDLGMIMVPADTPGLSVHPFWNTPVLAAAESEEIRLTDLFLAEDFLVRPESNDPSGVDRLQAVGFIWFEFIVSAVYLGMARGLAARVFDGSRGSVPDRAALGVRIEAAGTLVEAIARRISDRDMGNDALAKVVMTRYALQDTLTAVATEASELLGGMAFIGSADIAYLIGACHALAFHPPSRTSSAERIVEYLDGGPFRFA